MGMETMSPAAQPVYSVGGGDSDNGGAWMWVMMLFFLLAWGGGGGGFGFGNQGAAEGALTRADLCNEFNFNNLNRSVLGIQDGLCDGFYAMNNGILNGFSGQTAQMQQGFFGTERAIAENRFAQQNCCCETNRNIDAVRYENSQQTCEIANAIHAEGEATRALMPSYFFALQNYQPTKSLTGKILNTIHCLPPDPDRPCRELQKPCSLRHPFLRQKRLFRNDHAGKNIHSQAR